MKHTLSLLIMLFTLACTAQAQTAATTVTSKKLGWTITAPAGFENMPQQEVNDLVKKGEQIVEASGNDAPDPSVTDNIAVFKKDQFNMFHASAQNNMGVSIDSIYRSATSAMYDAYVHMGLTADTSTTKETVGGRQYLVFNVKISANGREVLQQKSYFANIKTYAFSASILSNNEADKQTLLTAFKNSVWK